MIRSVINKIVDDSEGELYTYLTSNEWYFDKELCGNTASWELVSHGHIMNDNEEIDTNYGNYFGDKKWCVFKHGLKYTTRWLLYDALQKYYNCDDMWIECSGCPYADTCKVPQLVEALIPMKTLYCGFDWDEYWGAECVYKEIGIYQIVGTDIEISQDEVLTVERPVCDDCE